MRSRIFTPILALLVFFLGSESFAQTFTGTNFNINDAAANSGTVSVSGVGVLANGADITVRVQYHHTFNADLAMWLVGPGGQTIELMTIPATGDDHGDIVFSDRGSANITTVVPTASNSAGVCPPTTFAYNGTYRPEGRNTTMPAYPTVPSDVTAAGTRTFANTYTNVNANGTWTLHINDHVGLDAGATCVWSISFTKSTFTGQNFTIPTSGTAFGTANVACVGTVANGSDITLEVQFNHTWISDVYMWLVGPGGQVLELQTGVGNSNNNEQITFTDNTTTFITAATIATSSGGGCPPSTFAINGFYRPEGRNSAIVFPPSSPSNVPVVGTFTFANRYSGLNADGQWRLYINDHVGGDGGATCYWRLNFSGVAPDVTPPTITCPANITTGSTSGACGAIVNFPTPVTSDNCPGVVVTSVPAAGSLFPVGTTTVVSTATDAGGNTASCSFTITVTDTEPPTITCPTNITVNNQNNQCGAVVNFQPIASDNCPIPGGTPVTLTQSSSQTPVSGSSVACNAGGFHTDNSYYRVYNLAPMGLPGPLTITQVPFGIELASSASTQPVTVRIHTLVGTFNLANLTLRGQQTFQVPNQTLSTFNANLSTPVTVPANATVVVEIFTPAGAGNRFFLGSNPQPQTGDSYIMATACGIAQPVTTAAVGFPNTHWILNINGTSNNGAAIITSAPASGSFFPVGTTTVTSTATDPAGNSATCSFTVTVVDNQAPVINCPANVTVTTLPGQCTFAYTYNVTATDNCPGVTTAQVSGLASGAAYPLGTTTNTWRATDAAGNQTNCTWTVTVLDYQLPVISVQPSNQAACFGTTATFSVTSTNALSYQWQISAGGGVWNNIAGATGATYSIPNVTHAMNTNTYRVQVIGLCTTVTSAFATLTVNALPTVAIEPSIAEPLLPGQFLTLTAVANPGGGSYVWRRDNVIVYTGGPELSGLDVDDAGSYTVTYTDQNGCVRTSAAHVVEANASDFLYVYPNPNNGSFHVRFYNATGESMTVKVYDSKGAKVFEQRATTNLPYSEVNVNLNVLTSSGIYLVEVYNGSGERVGAKRVLVRHP